MQLHYLCYKNFLIDSESGAAACMSIELWGQVYLPPILNKEHTTLYPLLIHTYVFMLVWQRHEHHS